MGNVSEPRIIIRKIDRVNYIMDGVCSYYGITHKELCQKHVRSPKRLVQKRITMKILHDIADLSLKDIGYYMGYDTLNPSNMYQHLYTISAQIDKDYVGNKGVKMEYDEVLNHLKLKT